ncbi:hypothetical protein ACROYT_G015763 [Oculina patagonica]
MAKANPTNEKVTSEQNEDHQVGDKMTDRERRERIPTEKGDSLRLERLFEERKAAGVALRRQIRSRRAKTAAKATCLQVEMEAAYKKLVMQKKLANARAEEETMRKIEQEERQEDFTQISKHEIPILDVKPKLPPKEEPGETKPLQDDGILNPKAPPEAALATDPVFSPEALKEARKNEFTSCSSSDNNTNRNTTWRNNGRRDKSASSFSTSATPHEDQPPPCSSCPFCNSQQHDLEKYSSFKKKTVQEKRAFVQEARICFGCFCYGHMSRRCRNRKVCKTCSMPHPTVLHDESRISPKQSSEDQARVVQAAEATSSCTSTCNATGVIDAIMNFMIVPVRMYHQDNPERQVVIYALLKPASNGTFVKESVLEELQVKRPLFKVREGGRLIEVGLYFVP